MLPPEIFGVPLFEFMVIVNLAVCAVTAICALISAIKKERLTADAVDAIKWLLTAFAEKGANPKRKRKTEPKLVKKTSIESTYEPSKGAKKLVEKIEKNVGGAY